MRQYAAPSLMLLLSMGLFASMGLSGEGAFIALGYVLSVAAYVAGTILWIRATAATHVGEGGRIVLTWILAIPPLTLATYAIVDGWNVDAFDLLFFGALPALIVVPICLVASIAGYNRRDPKALVDEA